MDRKTAQTNGLTTPIPQTSSSPGGRQRRPDGLITPSEAKCMVSAGKKTAQARWPDDSYPANTTEARRTPAQTEAWRCPPPPSPITVDECGCSRIMQPKRKRTQATTAMVHDIPHPRTPPRYPAPCKSKHLNVDVRGAGGGVGGMAGCGRGSHRL